MLRKITRRWDENNRCWNIRYYRVYRATGTISMQPFATSGREYVGAKIQHRADNVVWRGVR
jgi:hypothetical protein